MPKRVLIIGAGPAGLTTLKTLLHYPNQEFDPVVLELSHRVGGTFDQRAYENGHLVSSKQLTSFSDFRFPPSTADHVSLPAYVAYLERYVAQFGLDSTAGPEWEGTAFEDKSRIQFGVEVVRVDKVKGGGHLVAYRREGETDFQTIQVDALAICTGLHVLPSIPTLPGLSHLQPQIPPILPPKGTEWPSTPPETAYEIGAERVVVKEGVRVIHSSQYRERREFEGRKVLILGIGETSMDLSYEAIQAGAKEVVVCHRGGFLSFPKVLNDFKVFGVRFEGNLPIDGLITNLFETTYVHRWVAVSHIRWFISDFVIKRVLWVLTGTMEGCNQWVGGLPSERLGRAYVFLNKSTRAIPYMNKPYKPRFRLLSFLTQTSYIDPPDAFPNSHIDLAPFPSHISSSGRVHFPTPSPNSRKEHKRMAREDKVVQPDLVVFATGYRQEWGWLGEGYPRGPGDERVDVREVCSKDDVSVGWIGFVRPGVGAIPPIAEMQAMLWAQLLLGKIPVPSSLPTYRLLSSSTARIQYGVDHSTYMSTLAKDMGAAPSLWALYRNHGLHVLLTYCFGAAFPSFYRLEGPYKSAEMDGIVKTELWETITRRGLIGNIFMGVIPMAFYAIINVTALVLELLWLLAGQPDFSSWFKKRGMAPKVAKKKVEWQGM